MSIRRVVAMLEVVHSLGFWGFYAWMDFTHGYYGVLVFSSAIELARTSGPSGSARVSNRGSSLEAASLFE